ncbi:unnamed protein product [Urochloa decumbens]|uniref:Uncharacterized protein n=1 Tax=Urochloa decumbens TaxID=240449 RepID=A0ABC9AIN1_9POAL
MLRAANVTARPRWSGSGGAVRVRVRVRLAAVMLLVALLIALCIARADAAASLAGRTPSLEKGVASALENARAQEVVERGYYSTLAAADAEEEEDGPVLPQRVELEEIEDYKSSGPNNRHEPHP